MRSRTLLLVVGALVLAGVMWASGGLPGAAPEETASSSGIVAVSDLPVEAIDTLALIDAGGPFPYEQDDRVFYNRERLLPDRTEGYYREYTVDTPGSDDRGARRIVAGDEGELYWTEDHYQSFERISR